MISVLLVDDKLEFRDMAKKMLERGGGLGVVATGSAEHALEMLKNRTFDMIIASSELRGMNGIELLDALRALGTDTPTIIYGSQGGEKVVVRALRGGAEFFLQKSGDPRSQFMELRHVIEEIAKRKHTESMLIRREKDFRTIVEKNADAMLVLDREGSIKYANPASSVLFNLPQSDIMGKVLGFPIILDEPVEMYIVRGFQEFVAAEMRMVEVEWEEESSYLISFRDVTGHVRYEEELEDRVSERTETLRLTNEQLLGEIETRKTAEEALRKEINDRTATEEELRCEIEQREVAERTLEEAKAQAELYLDLMGHDINNLNQIGIGYLELARESSSLEEMKSLIEKPLEAMRSASDIIDNVRKLKQVTIDQPDKYQTTRTIDMCGMLPGIIDQYSQVKGRDIRINIDAPKVCYIKANDLIKDVFTNLVDNAIKHSDPIRPLTIDIKIKPIKEKKRQYLFCTVEDNGPGIPDWIKDKIFLRFQRGSTKAHGKGLGLYLVKKLVESYNGAVWVEDRIPGVYNKGAKFIVTLPAAE
ncbi:putative hybrid sensor and regulator [Methanocella paludicola SANAE]|uniref:histidine kinase n=1 Tax=Methanocella paludicola (strain DSM 17711 / JCM 13418 / NBRC 101707 / SANAE) TaxID=304371 RepID=D1Z0I2_METPS|nr:ATP-binding protein [Methanocella paludicola]BAI62204.1 putative hybrid sensor and regulator [Methanocella paludicola SANAE]